MNSRGIKSSGLVGNGSSSSSSALVLLIINVMMLIVAMNNFLIMTEAKFELIGHRGAPNLRPEHTYESYLLAFQQDADYIEFDVMPSKDGVLMVTHSFELTGRYLIENL